VRKVVGWPQAMDFQDVLKMRTTLDRAAGYAEKINELASEDCGLQAWVLGHDQKRRGGRLRRVEDGENDVVGPLASFGRTGAKLRRRTSHMSGTSIATEMTFPMRPDAYSATNLLSRTEESGSELIPPNLPYPSLASMRIHNLSNGPRTTAKGFFASIGRRASAKRERPQVLQTAYRSPKDSVTAQARPIILEKAPTLPGGPRAIPKRSSAIMTSMPSLFANSSQASVQNARLPNSQLGSSGR